MPKTPTSSPVKKEPSSPYGKNSNGGGGGGGGKTKWTDAEKQAVLLFVLESAKPDWKKIEGSELFGGRTATQIKDQWRQILLPSLKKNGSLS